MPRRSNAKKTTTKKTTTKDEAPPPLELVDTPAEAPKPKPTAKTLFNSAQPKISMSNLPDLSPAMGRMVETTFEMVDPAGTYDELIAALNKRRDALTPGTIRSQLADAARLYREAHRLYIVARHDQERFDNEHTIVFATLREEAKTELEAEKSVGKLKKTITDADVVARMSRMYPDEYAEMQDRAIRARKMVEHLKHLVDVFKNRMRALATLAGTREEL